MKKTQFSVLVLTLIMVSTMLFVSCKKDNDHHDMNQGEMKHSTSEEHHEEMKMESPDITSTPLSDHELDDFNTVLASLAVVSQALADDDLATAKTALAATHSEIEHYNSMADSENSLTTVAGYIVMATAVDSIVEIRTHYESASQIIYSYIKTKQIKTADTYYINYCPMYTKDGGYWVDNSAEIKNPYYGSSMLACGETKLTTK